MGMLVAFLFLTFFKYHLVTRQAHLNILKRRSKSETPCIYVFIIIHSEHAYQPDSAYKPMGLLGGGACSW